MLPFLRRIRAGKRINKTIGLWYHPDYAPQCLARTNRTLSIQVDRSELILDTLGKWKLLKAGDVRAAPLASLEDLTLVHPLSYLESVSSSEVLGYVFGINVSEVCVQELLASQRRAVGGTIEAALAVARGELHTAFNLGGGFHHAEPEQGGGFCIYNDVAIAVAKLRQSGFTDNIAIIDVDYHQGNGNTVAFANDPSVLTFSMDGSVWSHVEATANIDVVLPAGTGDVEYLAALRKNLSEALRHHRPKFVFYIAGNDVLAGDRLGDFMLSQEGVAQRDAFVVDYLRNHGDPGLVITMAGGYSEKAWQSTASFVHWLLTDQIKLKRWPNTNLKREFSGIARRIRAEELQKTEERPGELIITEEDILGDLIHSPQAKKLLGYYTVHGLEFVLERYGILKKLEERGFVNVQLSADLADETRQMVRLYANRKDSEDKTRYVLAELVVRRRVLPAPTESGLKGELQFFAVEWLLLQNPTIGFSLERPPLPGQAHPGLGLAHETLELFRQACNRLQLDGISSRPTHYHNAVVASALGFFFMSPKDEGRLQALKAVLGRLSLDEASSALKAQRVRLRDGTPIGWDPGEQILPVSHGLRDYFFKPKYQQIAREESRGLLAAGLHIGQ